MNKLDVNSLREIISAFMKKKRFVHTLGVEKEAISLGEIFLPNKLEKLQIAGLLHDITKNLSTEEHLALCDEYGIKINKKHISPKLLHAKTGCELARRKFGADIVDDEVYNGIFYHTTGREEMTLFEAIIYLADYIEENRTFSDCITLRNYFYLKLGECTTTEEKLELLRKTMILSFDMTIKNLIDEGKSIDYDTIMARNYFVNNENCWR